jgi:hypothetical protein
MSFSRGSVGFFFHPCSCLGIHHSWPGHGHGSFLAIANAAGGRQACPGLHRNPSALVTGGGTFHSSLRPGFRPVVGMSRPLSARGSMRRCCLLGFPLYWIWNSASSLSQELRSTVLIRSRGPSRIRFRPGGNLPPRPNR